MNEKNKKDDRLTDAHQMATIAHCMRDPRWFHRVKEDLRPNYFTNLICSALYTYLCDIYKNNGVIKIVTEEMMKGEIDQRQALPDTIKRYKEVLSESMRLSTGLTPGFLVGLIKKQRSHYEYLSNLSEVAKHAGTGDKEKTMEAAKKLVELDKTDYSDAPTIEETIDTLESEEKRWETSLEHRIPLVSADLNQYFMLIPGITLIGGVTKSGKSTVLANLVPAILDHRKDKKIFIITNEDNLDLVATRIACCSEGVSLREFRFNQHKMDKSAVDKVKYMKRCVASRIVVASLPQYDTTNMEIVQDLLMDAKDQGYSAIMLDYYQIVANSKRDPRAHYVDVSKKFGLWLKGYAADLTVPMIIFAQLKPHPEDSDPPFSQRVQADQTIANHVHVGMEIVRKTDDMGPITEIHCHLSRHGDVLGKIATFRYIDGRLKFQPPR